MNKEEILDILDKEGDNLKFEYLHIKCEMIRNQMKNWCGYIFIPNWHPLFDNDEAESIPCHGSVTYCEVVDNELKIGFDTAHSNDFSPYYILDEYLSTRSPFEMTGTYRDKDYVINEIHTMVDYIYDNYPETKRLIRESKLKELGIKD
jgi:hypothetical protein